MFWIFIQFSMTQDMQFSKPIIFKMVKSKDRHIPICMLVHNNANLLSHMLVPPTPNGCAWPTRCLKLLAKALPLSVDSNLFCQNCQDMGVCSYTILLGLIGNYMMFMCRPKIEPQADVAGKRSYLRLWLINQRDCHPLSTWILPDTSTQSATKRA